MHIDDVRGERLIGLVARVGFGVPGPSRFPAEWVWVGITDVTGELIYGRLLDEPIHVPGLRRGDVVCFKAEHVFRGEVHPAGAPSSRTAI